MPKGKTLYAGDPIRINVIVSDEAHDMMLELGRVLRPARKRPWGEVIDQLIREGYERHVGARDKRK